MLHVEMHAHFLTGSHPWVQAVNYFFFVRLIILPILGFQYKELYFRYNFMFGFFWSALCFKIVFLIFNFLNLTL